MQMTWNHWSNRGNNTENTCEYWEGREQRFLEGRRPWIRPISSYKTNITCFKLMADQVTLYHTWDAGFAKIEKIMYSIRGKSSLTFKYEVLRTMQLLYSFTNLRRNRTGWTGCWTSINRRILYSVFGTKLAGRIPSRKMRTIVWWFRIAIGCSILSHFKVSHHVRYMVNSANDFPPIFKVRIICRWGIAGEKPVPPASGALRNWFFVSADGRKFQVA